MIKPIALAVGTLVLTGCLPIPSQDNPTSTAAPSEPATQVAPDHPDLTPAFPENAVAQVNGRNILATQRGGNINEMINVEILAQAARQGGIPKDQLSAIQAEVDSIQRQLLSRAYSAHYVDTTEVTDSDAQSLYQELIDAQDPNEYQFRFAKFDTSKEAEDSIAAVNKTGEVDGDTYKYLVDSQTNESREWTTLSTLPPMFASLLPSLEVKSTTPTPIPSNQGYFVVYLEDKRDREFPSFDEVKEDLKAKIKEDRFRESMAQLRKKADIRIR